MDFILQLENEVYIFAHDHIAREGTASPKKIPISTYIFPTAIHLPVGDAQLLDRRSWCCKIPESLGRHFRQPLFSWDLVGYDL